MIKAGPVTKTGFPDESKFPEAWKTGFTDASGEVSVSSPPRGYLQIEAQCPPQREIPGATLGQSVLYPGTALDTVIEFRVRPHACVERAPEMAAAAAQHKKDVEHARVEAAARAVAGNWRGVLRDAKTGAPVPRAPMRVDRAGGIGFSDSTGHFWLWGFAPGGHQLLISCPVRRQFLGGKVAATIPFVARPAMNDTVDVRVPMDGCEDVPVDTVRVRTRGVWSIGFEDGFFTPCKPFTEIRLGGYRNFGEALLGFARQGIQPKGGWPKIDPQNGYIKVFLDVEGDLIGPGSYGHLGLGTFLLRVTRVFSAKAATPKSCSSAQ